MEKIKQHFHLIMIIGGMIGVIIGIIMLSVIIAMLEINAGDVIMTLLLFIIGAPCIYIFSKLFKAACATPLKSNHTSKESKRLTDDEIRDQATQKELELIIRDEKNRKIFEKYSINRIGKWIFPPAAISIISLFYFIGQLIYLRFAGGDMNSINWYLYAPGIVGGTLFLIENIYEEKWERLVSVKSEIKEKNPEYQWGVDKYIEGIFYTDSESEYSFYKTAKILTYLYDIIVVAILGFIAFDWIGNRFEEMDIKDYGIIIIILLIIIIIDQRRRLEKIEEKIDDIENQTSEISNRASFDEF